MRRGWSYNVGNDGVDTCHDLPACYIAERRLGYNTEEDSHCLTPLHSQESQALKITAFKLLNYRTLESVKLDFPSSYTAICGPNDCGKTNVVRAIRALMKEESPFLFRFQHEAELSIKDDYPKWKETEPADRSIQLSISLALDRDRDTGLYEFVKKNLSLQTDVQTLELTVASTYRQDLPGRQIQVVLDGKEYSALEAQEVLKRVQTSKSILFHNSTQVAPGFAAPGYSADYLRELSAEHESLVESMKRTIDKGLAKIAKGRQQELQDLLGRLETKYRVSLSMPALDFRNVPFGITLGQKKLRVSLDDWGSGTKNRTLILLTLFRARQIGESEASASKITPVIIVEEPESFLHTSAQAEFGRVLHDLAEEFQVQVIVTTHSPYLLNMRTPAANILLRRRSSYRQLRETERVDTTGENWMQPFVLAMGLESEELKPWRDLILSGSDAILLVEGDTDKEYLEMLRHEAHGPNRLCFTGDIEPYHGTGALQKTELLRFIKNRHRKFFVTYDLEAESKVEQTLQKLGLQKKKQYLPIGVNVPGKKNIEGLLPECVVQAVHNRNTTLLQAATSAAKTERDSAKGKLKRLMLEEFKKKATPGNEFFGGFYKVVKTINKGLG